MCCLLPHYRPAWLTTCPLWLQRRRLFVFSSNPLLFHRPQCENPMQCVTSIILIALYFQVYQLFALYCKFAMIEVLGLSVFSGCFNAILKAHSEEWSLPVVFDLQCDVIQIWWRRRFGDCALLMVGTVAVNYGASETLAFTESKCPRLCSKILRFHIPYSCFSNTLQ